MGFGLTAYIPYVSYTVLLLLVVISVYRVQYGIYYLIPFFPFRTIYNVIEKFPLGNTLIDLIFTGMFASWLLRKDRKVHFSYTYIPVLFLVVTTFFGVINGVTRIGAGVPFLEDPRLRDWKNYVMMPAILVLVLNNIHTKEEIKKSCLTMFAVVAIQGLMFYRNFSDRSIEHFTYQQREGGTFVFLGPNHVASFFVEYGMICLALFFGVKKEEGGWFKALCGGTFLLSVYATVWLFSRGAYAGLVAAIGAYAVVKKRILIPFLVVLVLFWQSILPTAVVERISSTLEEGTNEHETLGHRGDVWEKSLNLFKENPVFGIGYRTFQFTKARDERLGDSHNMYLSVMAEMGVVGLAAFVLILLTALSRGFQLYRIASDPFLKYLGLGFFLSTISVAVMNVFGDRWSYIMMQAFYWAFWGLVEKGVILSRVPNAETLGS